VTEYDAVIVGAGVIGLSTAYHIKRLNPRSKVWLLTSLMRLGRGALLKVCLLSVACSLPP